MFVGRFGHVFCMLGFVWARLGLFGLKHSLFRIDFRFPRHARGLASALKPSCPPGKIRVGPREGFGKPIKPFWGPTSHFNVRGEDLNPTGDQHQISSSGARVLSDASAKNPRASLGNSRLMLGKVVWARLRAWACLWACLSMFGLVWACLGLFGPVWACLGLFGLVRARLDSFELVWACWACLWAWACFWACWLNPFQHQLEISSPRARICLSFKTLVPAGIIQGWSSGGFRDTL